jgi:pyruvyl transferase EpsO
VALLDWPDYPNVGDSALWLGAERALALRRARVVHVASQACYDPAAIDRALGPEGVVVILGGGNFGDLYPAHQQHRERVVSDLAHRPVIQLPVSIHFDRRGHADAAGKRFRAHPGFTLMVRDRASAAAARHELGIEAVLAPDLAMALGPLPRPRPPTEPVTWQSRQDDESPRTCGDAGGLPFWDWARVPGDGLASRGLSRAVDLVNRPTGRAGWTRSRAFVFHLQARRRVAWGLSLLGRGRVVVTNRLHGHILSVLMGLPQFLSDNRQGKIGAYYQSWTAELPWVTWCASEAEAVERGVAAGGRA